MQRPPGLHQEVFNDLNNDLINFWMMTRDHPEELQACVDTLPYSRTIFEQYRACLRAGEPLNDLERAARWFYLLRSTFGGHPRFKGWGYCTSEGKWQAQALRSATALLVQVAERFRLVQIENPDFERLIQTYQTPRTLFYCDPPYIGCEAPYKVGDAPLFTEQDHRRLAVLLNETPSLVVLSYYEHPWLDNLYPTSRWRRMIWAQSKAIERTRGSRQLGREVLLMNYPESLGGLWQEQPIETA
ncbi:MAG: DNA adenine methylase [Ktedonobacteraceae bacterium]|nr:DNA adenine methylase [Ktedonobacteraceae bacterium]